ncbi:hypothetical protein BC939DRAFT_508951 [Gamsiella multidivaricata]|uniref:uncharacterized protein n=1 Tax=Gamsiella multidivaricata TaxID=101098 RepID=UPI00221FDB86|nr:uncharacterized protein BC939DRAFT_508951 [Gamsiella multidivaricata]KAI7815778.1 hypothetical protein BC939DRAFT_508951 [Gamsiella multidivaricata]
MRGTNLYPSIIRDDVRPNIHDSQTRLQRVPAVAAFANKFEFKKEALRSYVHSPRALVNTGITVAMRGDYPTLDLQHLVRQVSVAHHYCFTELGVLAFATPFLLGCRAGSSHWSTLTELQKSEMRTNSGNEQSEPPKFKDLLNLEVPKVKDDAEEWNNENKLSVVIRSGEFVCTGYCKLQVAALEKSKKEVSTYSLSDKGVVVPLLLSLCS